MTSRLIVITGPRCSGKTELARVLEEHEGYKAQNVGDLLAGQLEREGALPADREDIGRAYLGMFGIGKYHQALEDAGGEGVVLDGVRLVSAMRVLRDRWPSLLHLARPSREPSSELSWEPSCDARDAVEPFADQVMKLQAMANILITWQPSVDQLPGIVHSVLQEAHAQCDSVSGNGVSNR